MRALVGAGLGPGCVRLDFDQMLSLPVGALRRAADGDGEVKHSESDNGYSGDMWNCNVECPECRKLPQRTLSRGIIEIDWTNAMTGKVEAIRYS